MFENLSQRLQKTIKNLSGLGKITESNIKEATDDIRTALLEADVALPVIDDLLIQVKQRALGQEVITHVSPGQAFIKTVHDELIVSLGSVTEPLNFSVTPPMVILMAGLQGSGKTTTVAKLARWLKDIEKKSVLVTSADIYRPAAIEQLKTLAKEIGVLHFDSNTNQNPVDIANNAVKEAKKLGLDIVIIDTAGRLHIDSEMMTEIKNIHQAISPHETLFVVDSMTGQDAANTAKAFNDALPITGVVLTKTDGDARGGAALSIRHITQKPIKFMGVGEKTDALETFHPDRIASRILGMGDIVSLVEEAKRHVDEKEAEKTAKKVSKGQFDLEDYAKQLEQMENMGGISKLLGKLPGMPSINDAMKHKIMGDQSFKKHRALIQSMTPKERRYPTIIAGSRRRRIAAGAGLTIQDVNALLKKFEQMQLMFKKMAGGGMAQMMQKMQGMMGKSGFPPFNN